MPLPNTPGLAAAALVVAAIAAPAAAHDWYPFECCSDQDCAPVDGTADVEPVSGGWLIHATGEVIPYGDRRIRTTPREANSAYHRCSVAGRETGRTLCLFVPRFGS